jgi:hypothetical protein
VDSFFKHPYLRKIDILIAFIAVFLGRLDISEEAKYTLQFRKFLINDEPKTWSFGLVNLPRYFVLTDLDLF